MLRIIYNFFVKLSYIKYQVYLQYYKIIFSHVKWGKNIVLCGCPIFRFIGNVSIGNNVIFTSKTKYNMVGLTKPCSILVQKNASLHIGDHTGFSGVSIFCSTSIIIGQYCNIGGNVFIWDTDFHPLDSDERRCNSSNIKKEPITIGNNVFIGANSLILKGVTIGNNSVVGAGSVVTKNISDREIWAGNPAKLIRKINT